MFVKFKETTHAAHLYLKWGWWAGVLTWAWPWRLMVLIVHDGAWTWFSAGLWLRAAVASSCSRPLPISSASLIRREAADTDLTKTIAPSEARSHAGIKIARWLSGFLPTPKQCSCFFFFMRGTETNDAAVEKTQQGSLSTEEIVLLRVRAREDPSTPRGGWCHFLRHRSLLVMRMVSGDGGRTESAGLILWFFWAPVCPACFQAYSRCSAAP